MIKSKFGKWVNLREKANEEGAKSSLMDKKDWSYLDVDLYIWESGRIYFEINHHKFWFDHNKLKRDCTSKLIEHGSSHLDNADELTETWDTCIDKYNPDEYFVDQFHETEGYSYNNWKETPVLLREIKDDNDYLG